MTYHVYLIRENEIVSALVFEGENKDDISVQLQACVENGGIEPFDEVVIEKPEDCHQSEGDYYENGVFYYPLFCAVLNNDDYCIGINKMPFKYKEGDEAENEVPIDSNNEVYIGAYFDGDRWDFENRLPQKQEL